ncbi:MAG: selenide, water dikinase SelD [Eubacteriales bacterium]|nr:selenide, water dikinase SelD [Eubacteriales bacterium]
MDCKLSKLAKCAGCGAKVGAGTLSKLLTDLKVHSDPNLLVGFDTSDDASVYRINDELALVHTIDFFPPMVDDPYTFGQIAATNALSDIYAMGGEPKLAQNVLIVPENMPKETVHEILRGGYDKVYEAGAMITGGHSIYGDEPVYGLAVTGFVRPDRLLTNCGAREGDILFLTKPLGIGIMMTALKAGLLSPEGEKLCVELTTTLNRAAAEAIRPFVIHACTDVTGFSLMGHGLEMAEGSDTSLVIHTEAVHLLPEAVEMARMGVIPEGMYRNREFAEAKADLGHTPLEMTDVLFDPQTSGGLLIAADRKDADKVFDALKTVSPWTQQIGEVVAKRSKRVILV